MKRTNRGLNDVFNFNRYSTCGLRDRRAARTNSKAIGGNTGAKRTIRGYRSASKNREPNEATTGYVSEISEARGKYTGCQRASNVEQERYKPESAERELWAAVLDQAVQDLFRKERRDSVRIYIRRNAINWIWNEKTTPHSFIWVCQILDLNYQELRIALKKMVQGEIAMKTGKTLINLGPVNVSKT